MPRTYTWHPSAIGECEGCGRRFRISEEAIKAARKHFNTFDEAVATITFCLTCVQGEDVPGEHVASVYRWGVEQYNTSQGVCEAVASHLDHYLTDHDLETITAPDGRKYVPVLRVHLIPEE